MRSQKNYAMKQFKIYLFILFAVVAANNLHAQSNSKWVIMFKDKNNTPFKLNKPIEYLSRRAIQRRVRDSIKLDSTDLPVNATYIAQVVAQGPVTYLSQSKWLNQILINCSDAATLTKISNLPFVKGSMAVGNLLNNDGGNTETKFKETVTPMKDVQSTLQMPDVNYNYGQSYNQIHIHNGEFLHQKGFTGKGFIITLLDAGFNQYRTTKCFDSVRARNGFLGEKDFVDYDNSVNEDYIHGEECLSTIAANVPGVMVGTAPDANFWLIRTENAATEQPIEEQNWVAGAEFADSAGTDLISCSLGYTQFDNSAFDHTYANFYNNSTICSKGAAYAAKKGILVTNSAGNSGADSWKYLGFPSDADSVAAIAACDVNGNIAYFSSFGYPGKIKPNITSVGYNTVLYTPFGVSTGSGTSFSNPNINGLICCLWQAFPQLSNMEILKAVYATSDRARTPDNRFGYGIPNMKRAYILLKQRTNLQQFGSEWLFANAQNANTISVKIIALADAKGTVKLLDKSGNIIAQKEIITEEAEAYDLSFDNISSAAFVEYTDGQNSRRISVSTKVIPVSKYSNTEIIEAVQ